MKFDHVAIGVRDHREGLSTLTGELGGLAIGGDQPAGSGFRSMQVRLGRGSEGMTVELLEPAGVEHNDFLERFLARGGDRTHHVTFKTEDIAAERKRLQAMGFEPVAVDLSDPGWQEMFIHPSQAHGTVIQIAQSNIPEPPMEEWLEGLPGTVFVSDGDPWWDSDAVQTGSPTFLRSVVIETPQRLAGDHFYSEVLGSEVSVSDRSSVHRWEGGSIRLVDADVERPQVAWLEVDGLDDEVSIGSARFCGVER